MCTIQSDNTISFLQRSLDIMSKIHLVCLRAPGRPRLIPPGISSALGLPYGRIRAGLASSAVCSIDVRVSAVFDGEADSRDAVAQAASCIASAKPRIQNAFIHAACAADFTDHSVPAFTIAVIPLS
jgi:hypothetical protein